MKTIFFLNLFATGKEPHRLLFRASKVEEDIPVSELPMVGDTMEFLDSKTRSQHPDWQQPVIRVRRFYRNEKWGEERRVHVEMKTDSRALMDHLVANEGWKFNTLAV